MYEKTNVFNIPIWNNADPLNKHLQLVAELATLTKRLQFTNKELRSLLNVNNDKGNIRSSIHSEHAKDAKVCQIQK
jgi:hypothetical protein